MTVDAIIVLVQLMPALLYLVCISLLPITPVPVSSLKAKVC